MTSTDLKLKEQGSLAKPGPVGHLTRLCLGMLCLYYVFRLLMLGDNVIADNGSIRPMLWNGIVIGLFLVNYVINIGFSRSWKKRPAVTSAILFLLVALAGYAQHGTIETPLLAHTIRVWAFYVFSHLGLAFVLAALIGTPGCEMRAFHHVYSLLTGKPTREHYCPVGPLGPIDQWESKQPWYAPRH